MKKYTVVVFPPSEGIEVVTRDYDTIAPRVCEACGQSQPAEACYRERDHAAFADGEEFGKMLVHYGSQEFQRGMVKALRDAGFLQSTHV